MLEPTHEGAFTDRLVVAGSEDPLLYGAFSSTFKHHAVTRLGELHRNLNQTRT